MKAILLIDFGSTYTKVTAVDLESERLLGTARAFTTAGTDISEGLDRAVEILSRQTGRLEFAGRYACSSAAGGLKMVTVGLVPDLTAEAGRRAALSAGAKVTGVFSYELSNREAEEIRDLEPDILLLTGGTDGGNKNVILHNAGVIAAVNGEFPVVVAGNKSVAGEAAAVLKESGKEVRLCGNVMPEFNVLNIEPAREAIRDIFLQRIIRAKGLTKVAQLIEGILMPTPSAVLNAAVLLSQGHGSEKGLGDLMVVDVGGATTDVHTIGSGSPTRPGVMMKGLPEPFAKRTVEGDLGVRYGASSLTEAVGLARVAKAAGLAEAEAGELLKSLLCDPGLLPGENEKLGQLDYGLTAMAVKYAVERHAGRVETSYSPFGAMYMQTGKDLGGIRRIIGTGGPVINGRHPEGVLAEALFDEEKPVVLKPRKAEFLLDRQYILAAMGLLGGRHPEIALRMMKRQLEVLN